MGVGVPLQPNRKEKTMPINNRQPRKGRGLRLARRSKVPKNSKAKIVQIERIVRDLVTGYRHFATNPANWRDSPARRRFQANRQELAERLDGYAAQAPEKTQELRDRVEQELKTKVEEIDQHESSYQEGQSDIQHGSASPSGGKKTT
jgi:hypothetical protein